VVDRLVECVGVGEGLVGEMMRLEVAPDGLDVVQFRSVFGQPLDGEPMCAGGERRERALAGVDGAIVLDQHHRREGLSGPRTIEPIELLEMGDEIAAALGRAGVDDAFADRVIERAQQRDLLGLSRCGDAQVCACLRPGTGEVGMRQRLALIAIEQNDVAGFGLLLAQLQAQADPLDLGGVLPALQRVPRPPPAELFLRSALDNCERLMRTPAWASISARRRGMVQLRRSATGASSNGMTTRNAASLFTGAGPGATVAFRAATPPRTKSLRHSRTVSSRTPNASAMRGLVPPASVSSTARARSASPRSREPASAVSTVRCSSVAESGDCPAMPCTYESVQTANQPIKRWSSRRRLLSLNARLDAGGEQRDVIDSAALLVGLAADLRAMHLDMRPITLEIEAESQPIAAQQGKPLELLLNELVVNAVKYAFPDGRAGEVHIGFRRDGADYVLTVTDDGIGNNPTVPVQGIGLGKRFVRALAQQIDGAAETGPGKHGGTEDIIRGPIFTD